MINKESIFANTHRKTKEKESTKYSQTNNVLRTKTPLASLFIILAALAAAPATAQTTPANFGIGKVSFQTNPKNVSAPSQLIMNVLLAPSGTTSTAATTSSFYANGDQIVLSIAGRESFQMSNTTSTGTNSGSCTSMTAGIYITGCLVNSTTAIVTLGQMSAQYSNFTVSIKTFLNPPADMPVRNISVKWVANGGIKGSYFGSEINGFMPGTIKNFVLIARDSPYSGEYSRYEIYMSSQHSIPGNSQIEILFPQSFYLNPDNCYVEYSKAPMLSTVNCMTTTTNTLVLQNPFAQTDPYKPEMYQGLSFAPSFWGKNPFVDNTTTANDGFAIYTYFLDPAGNKYLIDKNWFPLTQAINVQSPPPSYNQTTSNQTGTNQTQPPSNTTNETKPYYNQTTPYLYAYFSAVSSYVAGDQYVSYVLEIVPSKTIPVGGIIKIEFPPEISSPASKYQTFQAQTEVFCGYYKYSTGEYINTYSYGGYLPMTFKMIYQGDSDIQSGQNLQIFCHGFNNPRTTDPTSSFIIETFDAQGTYLERNEYPVVLYIYQAAYFKDFQIFTSNQTAPSGKFEDYTFSISSSVEHYYGEALFIEFPWELQLTTVSSCLWEAASEYKLQCDFIPTNNTLKVTLNFAMNVYPAGAPINFNVTGVNVSAGVQKNYSTFYNARIVDQKDRLLTQLYYKVPVRYFGQEVYYYNYPPEYYNSSYNSTENNTYNKYPEYNNTNGTYPPPPQNGTTNGTYPPPPPQNGSTNGTYPPPQNGTAGGNQTYPPPPPQNGTNQTNPPPYNGTNQNWTYPPYQNGTNYTKPPMNGTNSTYPPPQNGTNQTAPPPQNNTGNTTMPPKNQTNGTQMPIGTIVQNRMLYQNDIALGKNSTYYIIYQTMTLTNAGSTFMIQVPRNVRVEPLISVFIMYQNQSYKTDFKIENRTIKLYNFYIDVPAGDTIQISLESLINPMTQLNSQSFMLTSFTDSSFTSPIDSIVDGLDIRFECNYPCQSCLTEDMNYCLSCFDRSAVMAAFPNATATSSNIYNYTFPYLYYGMCYNKCPLGSFMADNRTCKSCPEGCATCQNEKSCSVCDRYSTTPFLNNGTCMTECPTGLCPNEGRCGDCSSRKFKTFNITASPKSMGQISTLMFNFSLDSTKNISFLPNDTIVINFPKEHGFDTSIESFASICNSLTTPFFLTACDVQYNIVKVVLGKQNTTSTTGAIYNTLAKGYLYYSFALSIQNFQNPLNKRSIENITAFLYDNATNTKAAILNARIDNFTAPQGQYFDNQTATWVSCPDSCTECFQDITTLQVKCRACEKGWLIDNSTALCRQNCTAGMIYDYELKSCVNCDLGLWSTWQANKCYQCPQNCFACNMKQSPNTTFAGTAPANTTTECTKCLDGYQFDLTRKICLIPCQNGTIYEPESNSCQPCKDNQFANYTSQQCKACPENCDKCDFNATSKRVECSVCSQNAGVFFDPLLKMCKLPCNASQFFDAPTYSCKDCRFGIRNNTKELQQCTICPSNCKTCAFNSTTQTIDCTSCATNQTLDFERKVCRPSCNNVSFYNWDTLECQRCEDFEYLHPVQQKCKPCPGNCQSCRFNTTAKKPTVPLVAQQTAISRLSRKLQSASDNNTFFDNTQNMTDTPTPVRQATEFDNYTPLFQNYLMNASCTSCFPGQVIDVDTLACRNECPVNSFFNWTINDCQPCKAGEYYNKLYKKCTMCPTSCTSCVANNTKPDQAVCTSCITDYIVENSICRKSCNRSQYYDSFQKTCGNCKYPCLQCSSSSQCLQCDVMYAMKDNKTCTFKCTAGKELWNNQTQSCQAIRSGIKLSIMTTPAKTSFKCREVTVTAQGQGITDNDQPIYVWSYSVQEMSTTTTSNAATTPSYTTAFKSGLEQLVYAANEQGSLMITVPSYLTSIVTRNVTVKFTLTMFIGAQNATNSTSILIQPTVYSELTDVESQYFIRAAEGFSLNASLAYPDCAAYSNSASDIIPYNRSLGCGLYNSTTKKLIKSLPGQCQIKPNELEMGTVYNLRINFIVNYMQPAIVKNITLVTTYEDPQCTIPVNGILNYVKISEKLALNPIVINKKSTLIYKWSAWPVNSNTKIQINGTNNNYNLSVTAASYLKVGNQYNIRLEITDSGMAETNSVCEVLVEAVNATAKTLRMAISDTANTRNYTDPTQNFTAVCLQTDEEFNNISYTWTVTRKPDNAVLFSSTVKSSLIVANQNSLSVYPSGFKYTSTGTSFEVACVAQNLKYYGKIAKTYTVTQLISTQVAVAVSPTSGRANETLFTVNVTVAKGYQNLNCGLQYYLSNSQFINITDFKEMFTSADGLKDTFKLYLDRANSTVDSQTIIALCTDDTGAYAKASTKVTVYKPAITNSTIATNTTAQTIRQVALESSGFLNP